MADSMSVQGAGCRAPAARVWSCGQALFSHPRRCLMRIRTLLFLGLIGWLPFAIYAQQPAKQAKAKNKAAEIRPPGDAARRNIDDKTARLNAALDQLRGKRVGEDVLAEVEIYAKAVEWV